MSNIVIVDQDKVTFSPKFGANTVTPVAPTSISGSGEASILNKKICILGDEKKIKVDATYVNETYTLPGNGTITITQLAADQQAEFATCKTAVIVVGSKFDAMFTPTKPAQNPKGDPDPNMSPVNGTGQLINSQSFVTASK